MFSRRTDHESRPNRISLALARTPPTFDLTESNPTRAELPYPSSAHVLEAFDNAALRRYEPDPHGVHVARAAIAATVRKQGPEIAIDPAQITLASGTSEAYGYLFKLLCDPGDEVLIPEPSYPLFADLCRLEHVRTRSYPLRYDGQWHIDLAQLRASIGERTRAVMIVSPNNPTGSYLKRAELAELERLGLPLISDEVFSEYPLRADPERVYSALESRQACVLSLGGLSKLAALPQWKVAWICAQGPNEWSREVHRRLALIADTYLSVATPTQVALPRLLELCAPVREAIKARLLRNLAALRARLTSSSPLTLLDVEGGFYVTLRLPRVLSEEEWVLTLLEQDSVYVQPGFFFDFPDEAFVVLSLLTPSDSFDAGVGRLIQRVATCAR